MSLYGRLGKYKACSIFEVPVGSTSVYVEQDSADRNLLGKYNMHYAVPFSNGQGRRHNSTKQSFNRFNPACYNALRCPLSLTRLDVTTCPLCLV